MRKGGRSVNEMWESERVVMGRDKQLENSLEEKWDERVWKMNLVEKEGWMDHPYQLIFHEKPSNFGKRRRAGRTEGEEHVVFDTSCESNLK